MSDQSQRERVPVWVDGVLTVSWTDDPNYVPLVPDPSYTERLLTDLRHQSDSAERWLAYHQYGVEQNTNRLAEYRALRERIAAQDGEAMTA